MELEKKKVHFSIDDVGASLRWLVRNKPPSIFDMRFFSKLKELHDKYGLVVTLYCFYHIEAFCFSGIPDIYANEFEANRDWLHFGYHGDDDKPFYKSVFYQNIYCRMQKRILELRMGDTNILRLHCWEATCEQTQFLFSQGVHTLLFPDDERLNRLSRYASMQYVKTNFRFERVENIDPGYYFQHDNTSILNVFTHEKMLDVQLNKIEAFIRICAVRGYKFIY